MMRWGFPPPPKFGSWPVTYVRNMQSPYWRGWLPDCVLINQACRRASSLQPRYFAAGDNKRMIHKHSGLSRGT
jgi:hypothetical protein